MTKLSDNRTKLIAKKQNNSQNVFEAYAGELYSIYVLNNLVEKEMKAKDEAKKQAAEAKAGDDKKKAAKKKGKDGPPVIGFGKGTRQLFDYLQQLEADCGDDQLF